MLLTLLSAWGADVFPGELVKVVSPGMITGDEPVTVRVLAVSMDGSGTTGLALKPAASSGEVDAWQEAGEGWYSFRFTPPTVQRATPVELSVGGDATSVSVLVVPNGPVAYTVTVDPPALVLGQDGSAKLTVSAPDATLDALELSVSSGSLSAAEELAPGTFVSTYTPPTVNYPHLALVTVGNGARPAGSGQGTVVLKGAVDFPVSGTAHTAVALTIDGTEYGPSPIGADGKGKVPVVVSPGTGVAQRFDIVNGKRNASDFDLQLPETRRLAWFPSAGVPPDGGDVKFVVRTPTGEAAPTASPTVETTAGKLGPVRHLGAGVFQVRFTPSGAGTAVLTAKLGDMKVDRSTLEVRALPAFPTSPGQWPSPSKGAVAAVVVVPKDRTLDPGGTAEVLVAGVDVYGHPVPNTELELSAQLGTVPGSVKTGSNGVGTVAFKAGDAGFASIQAKHQGVRSSAAVLIGQDDLPIAWPASTGAQGLWEQLVPGQTVQAAAQKPAPSGTAGDVATLKITVPTEVEAGGTARVVVKALDADGRPVTGRELDFMVNLGKLGEVEEVGDGVYAADLKAPARGDVKITVIDSEGAMGRASVATESTSSEPPAHHIPRFRLRAGFVAGTYNYAQRPTDDPGPLLPNALVVGGKDGGSSAPLMGVDADVRGWIIKYFGLHAGFRATNYGIQANIFTEDVRDWLVHLRTHLAGRVPIRLGQQQIWFGIQAGFQIDDFLVFKGSLEPGTTVRYDPLLMPGLEVGGSIGGEFGPVFFIASFNQGLAQGTVPYRIGVDADLGLEVHRNVFIDLGLVVVTRKVVIRGEESGVLFGELADAQVQGRGSVGIAF